jgi:hypothetical protein
MSYPQLLVVQEWGVSMGSRAHGGTHLMGGCHQGWSFPMPSMQWPQHSSLSTPFGGCILGPQNGWPLELLCPRIVAVREMTKLNEAMEKNGARRSNKKHRRAKQEYVLTWDGAREVVDDPPVLAGDVELRFHIRRDIMKLRRHLQHYLMFHDGVPLTTVKIHSLASEVRKWVN